MIISWFSSVNLQLMNSITLWFWQISAPDLIMMFILWILPLKGDVS